MISINWTTKVITVPQADLTFVGGSLYELDVDAFRLALKGIEDSEEGVTFPDTHRHNTTVTLSGVTYARSVEIINGYTVTFQEVASPYRVRCVGANHNISDVQNLNDVSLIIGNAAGLIQVTSGSGLSLDEQARLLDVWQRLGLDPANPMVTTATAIEAGGVSQVIAETAGPTITVTRSP